MVTTDSLERSLGAFSITDDGDDDVASSSSVESRSPAAAITAVFSSHLFLRRQQWEQCLDLKTGEIYYVDLRDGRKVKGDHLTRSGYEYARSNNNKDHNDRDDEEGYRAEEASGDTDEQYYQDGTDQVEREEWRSLSSWSSSCISSTDDYLEEEPASFLRQGDVLVVTGCKRCFMYFMLPKIAEHCPKCSSNLLLHFNGTTTML